MKIFNDEVVKAINNQLEMWEDDWQDYSGLTLTRIVNGVDVPNERKVIYKFHKKLTHIKDHPVAYESTDEGAQGLTHFLYIGDVVIEIYDALDNYATIEIYNQ
jgi:hypothetical protein